MEPVIVSVQLGDDVVEAGRVFFHDGIGRITTRFRFEDTYLARPDAFQFDPAIPLDDAAHNLTGLPLSFEDAAPDHWGQLLLRRERERESDVGASDTHGPLSEIDFLLGVSDTTRQGALRFQLADDGPFLADNVKVPRTLQLDELLAAADSVADDDDPDWQALQVLLDAGTTALGGARAKAAITDGGRLHLAKFPMTTDTHDVMLWEMTALDLAERAGLDVPSRKLVSIGGRNVLLVERFDRTADGNRIGYISARTLMQHRESARGAPDYTGMAEAIGAYGSRPVADLHQLWRHVAFGALINNTDNHLRNHGFVQDGKGWRLAPVFDLNPNRDTGAYRSTGIDGSFQRRNTVQGLLGLAVHCRLKKEPMLAMLAEIVEAVGTWQTTARGHGATDKQIQRFAEAFTSLDDELEQVLSDR